MSASLAISEVNLLSHFAETSSSSSGLGAFHVNLKSFIFQLITFVIVLLIFRRWILPPITKTLENRQNSLEKSLADAKATEEALAKAEARAEEILSRARQHADGALAEGKKAAEEVIAKAEIAGGQRATQIVADAEEHLKLERNKLRSELKAELADLVADATEKLIQEKLDEPRDRRLIERIVGGIK